jgi:hypothetical protein
VFGSDQVPSQVEQIVDGGMRIQKSLRLPYRFEPAHTSLSHSRWLM